LEGLEKKVSPPFPRDVIMGSELKEGEGDTEAGEREEEATAGCCVVSSGSS